MIEFYTYGSRYSRRHVQTVDGKIPCGAKIHGADGSVDKVTFDGKIYKWIYRFHNRTLPTVIECPVSCDKCRNWIEKQSL